MFNVVKVNQCIFSHDCCFKNLTKFGDDDEHLVPWQHWARCHIQFVAPVWSLLVYCSHKIVIYTIHNMDILWPNIDPLPIEHNCTKCLINSTSFRTRSLKLAWKKRKEFNKNHTMQHKKTLPVWSTYWEGGGIKYSSTAPSNFVVCSFQFNWVVP